MNGDADIASVAVMMGEPSRAAMLVALVDGRAWAASTLAAEAKVAPSTASGHLARLTEGGLVQVETSGRHRYFRLAGPAVAEAIEALARLAPAHPVRSLRESTHAAAIRSARTCYDHLAGRLGVSLLDALISDGLVGVEAIAGADADPVLGAGRALRFHLTPCGRERLDDLGVLVAQPTRRPFVRYCLDWSEQRPHLGGALGAAMLERFVVLGWTVRADRRVVRVTEAGKAGMMHEFGVDVAAG